MLCVVVCCVCCLLHVACFRLFVACCFGGCRVSCVVCRSGRLCLLFQVIIIIIFCRAGCSVFVVYGRLLLVV